MSGDFHFYEPALGHGLKHNPFKALIAPRPIAWVSTVDREGRANLAPYSFFNAISEDPLMIVFASSAWKHSVRNASETGEFCVNLATRSLAEAMNLSSRRVPDGIDEFEIAGLEKAPCLKIKAPRVAASPFSLECRVADIVQLKSADGGKTGSYATFGEVVGVHINKAYIKDGVYQTGLAHPIMRAGRRGDYVEVSPEMMFEMDRPEPYEAGS